MSPEIDALRVALRVMTVLVEKQVPEPTDIETLAQIAPKMADGPVSELAYHVIRISRAPLSMPCQKCQSLEDDVTYAQRIRQKAMVRMTDSMNRQYEIYLGFRDAGNKASRELELACSRLREHHRSHRT